MGEKCSTCYWKLKTKNKTVCKQCKHSGKFRKDTVLKDKYVAFEEHKHYIENINNNL